MKYSFISTLSVLFLCLLTLQAYGQTPLDAIMMEKGEICFGLNYEQGKWDEYWEGTKLQPNGNIGTFKRTSVVPMFALGLIKDVNLLAGVPYIKTESDGGQLAGVDGFQDLSVALKANVDKQIGKGTLYFLPVIEFTTPVSNYLSDYAPYSIGLHTDQFLTRGILQYKLDAGPYLRGSAAHIWRTETKIERDYYYNNGSYYTEWMDVPNAWNFQAVLGSWFLNNSLRVQADYTIVQSTSGDDIRAWNAGQPTNKVEFDQVGGFAQYYFHNTVPGLGVLAYYSQVLEGRNMGKFSTFGVGLTYQFHIY